MSDVFSFTCCDIKATERLAEALSLIAKRGDTFALFGTLGVGKSVFARAFIQNLTDAKEVPSPTFTLVQTYEAPDFDIYHFDLYRLKSAEEIWELNMEEALFNAVSLIEWPEKMGGYLPKDVFKIFITANDDGHRLVQIETPNDEKASRIKKIHLPNED